MQSSLFSKPSAGQADELRDKLHVGIIMDGNGRWATRRGLSRVRGHEAGVEAIRRIVEIAPKQGVGTLTLYAFSTDNWRRPKAEVAALIGLPLGVVRVLLADLIGDGLVTVRPQAPAAGPVTDTGLLQKVLNGLQAL